MSRITTPSAMQGKVALITGASSGLGKAVALQFAQAGVKVILNARRTDRLQELVTQIQQAGGEAIAVAGDASRMETAESAVQKGIAQFGQIDFLINNAGLGNYKTLDATSVEEYDEMMNANMRSSFVFAKAVAPGMKQRRSGSMVFVSSVAGLRGTGNEAVYSASKAAQIAFAQGLDDELRPHGIQVTSVCPGGIKTEFALGKGRTQEGVDASEMMDAADVAEAVIFACTQPASLRILQLTIRPMNEAK